MDSLKKCTLVVPFYNEETRWNEMFWTELLEKGFSLCFVDDGSNDNTVQILKSFCNHEFNAHLISLKKNTGKANAIREGMNYALKSKKSGVSIIGFVDADCAIEVDEIVRLCQVAQDALRNGFQSVWASRVKLLGTDISRNESRHLISRVVTTFLSVGINTYPYDSQCGFKLFKADNIIRKSIDSPFVTRWFMDLELLNRLVSNDGNYKIIEVPLLRWKDKDGSKIDGIEKIRIFKEIIFIKQKLSKNPTLRKWSN